MSQKVSTRKGVSEEKEKTQTDSPMKDMKKKMAANAEKEKLAEKNAEKTEKQPEKSDKPVEKTDKAPEKKADKDKVAEKKADKEKATEKKAEKEKVPEKKAEKEKVPEKKAEKEKAPEKKTEKVAEKKTDKVEKKLETPEKKDKEDNKDDKAAKSDKTEAKQAKPKQNGSSRGLNGDANTNGTDDIGTVSEEDDSASMDEDEKFPELTYDDTSDPEFEPADALGRSITRRSQAKVTRTPETPRPASDKQADKDDDSKVLKLKEDVPSTDRKLRSADSPKPQDKKESQEKPQEPAKKTQDAKKESPKNSDKESKENEAKTDKDEEKANVEIVIDLDGYEDEPRKTDTNYSKSRVKVSPYRRSMRLADQTTSSVMANYTGNNTTMEMDITETSSFVEDASLDNSSYLNGLRAIRGRRSYKLLHELPPRPAGSRPVKTTPASDQPSRPTGTVVGRKRKPDADDSLEVAAEAGEGLGFAQKRMRLLDRIAHPFRRAAASSTPLPARRAAEIVGINTDLPLSAPVASADTFDPESLKPAAAAPAPGLASTPAASIPLSRADLDKDNKRCIVM